MRSAGSGKILYIVLILNGLFLSSAFSQATDSLKIYANRRLLTGISSAVLYSSTMTGLYSLWYKDNSTSSFHFFDDSRDWLYMDKIGHATTAYTIGSVGYRTFKWCGYDETRSVWIGSMTGLFFLTSVEVFDGFSSGYGFSLSDIVANSLGSGLFISQQLGWKEQRVRLKFSFHQTQYAKYRPDLLGNTLSENIIKDYNGQTYWLSANIKSFLPEDSRFPAWLNFAFGYGARGMTGASKNPVLLNGNPMPYFDRTCHFYISPDIDLSKIPTRSKILQGIFNALGILKFPLPTIGYSKKGGLVWSGIYF